MPALRHADGRLTEAGWEAEIAATKARREKSIEDQSFGENLVAGYGRALPVMWSGLKQTGTEAIRHLASDSTGLTPKENAVTRWADQSLAKQQQEIDSERLASADLMSTGGGVTGNVLGNLAPMLAGGFLARGTAAAGTFLPKTVGGNITQGAAYSGLQPTASGENRARNTAVGGAFGAAGHGASKLGNVGRLLPGVRRSAIEGQVGTVLDSFAANPAQVRQALNRPSEIVPGSLPTTAEASGDIGLANLQRTLQSTNTGGFNSAITARQEGNNLARVNAIREAFGGADDAAAEAIEAARNETTRRTLRPIANISLQDITPVQQVVDRLIVKNAAAPLVRDALETVKAELPNIKTVQDAHNVRQYIGQLIGGQVEGKAGAKLAQRELITVNSILDRQMKKAFPEWGKFLREHKAGSREAGQVKFGARLLDKSNSARDAAGNPVLNATALRAIKNPDTLAKAANPTFKRASADAMLEQPQKETIDAVRRDLERQMNTWGRGKAVGSNTFQNLSGGASLQQSAGPLAPLVGMADPSSGFALAIVNDMRRRGGERVATLVSEAMMDPQRAAEILARVPSQHRKAAIGAVSHVLRQSSIQGNQVRQTRQEPLEIDIIGGRRESSL